MKRLYFGTDGIRGTVGQAPITPDFMLRLANAVGHQLKQSETRPSVVAEQRHAYFGLYA